MTCHNANIDLKLLDIIGALRGSPVADDKDESSESGSEDDELGDFCVGTVLIHPAKDT